MIVIITESANLSQRLSTLAAKHFRSLLPVAGIFNPGYVLLLTF